MSYFYKSLATCAKVPAEFRTHIVSKSGKIFAIQQAQSLQYVKTTIYILQCVL